MLGDELQDYEILKRVDRFMKNGFHKIALDLGWSTENAGRSDWVGEINNTCDLIETCLYLGRNGFEGYYGRAEQMLRSRILPSQLLDVSFLSDEECEDASISRIGSRMKGAFDFPLNKTIEIPMTLDREQQEVLYKGKTLNTEYWGEQLERVTSKGKRLCFFPDFSIML